MFDDVRLDEDVERGAVGGPRFNTSIVEDDAGLEQRNQNWQYSRMRWAIGYNHLSAAEFKEILAFFYQRGGRARGFRFKDWSDYSTALDAAILAKEAEPQPVYIDDADPDNIVHRLSLWYGDLASYNLANAPHRIIAKPVDDTIKLYERQGGGWIERPHRLMTQDDYEKRIEAGTLPDNAGPILLYHTGRVVNFAGASFWSGEYDVPVRFDTDELNLDLFHLDSASAQNIPLVELNYAEL